MWQCVDANEFNSQRWYVRCGRYVDDDSDKKIFEIVKKENVYFKVRKGIIKYKT